MTQKKTLSAKDVLKDINAGMSHEDLMGKYQLSQKGLQSLLKKMVGAGILDLSLLDGNKPTQQSAYKGTPNPHKLSAKDVIADVKAGMSDNELMKKYKVSSKTLHSLFNKMIAAGILSQADIDRRQSLESTVEIIPDSFPARSKPASQPHQSSRPVFKFLCPKCNTPHTEEYAVCPQCGIIVEKFRQKQDREKRIEEPHKSVGHDSIAADSTVRAAPEGKEIQSAEPPVDAQLIELQEIGLITDSEFEVKRNELIRQGHSFSDTSTKAVSGEDHVSKQDQQPTPRKPVIKPRYERAFAEIEKGKPHQFNIWILFFGSFWYCFKGMWKKGIVIFSILVVLELILHYILPEDPEITGMSSFLRFAKLQIIWWAPNIGLSFIGNWDYYLFMRHGEDFFTPNTWEGYRGAFPENLTLAGRQQSHVSSGVSPYFSEETLKRNRRIGIAVIAAFIVVELVKATLLSSAEMGNKLVFNNGELYYSSSMSETHVNQLGNYLIRAGIFGGDQVSAKLDRKGNTYQVRLIVREGVVMNPGVLTGMQHLASGISRQVFGGAPVEVHLCNSQFETLRVVSSTQSGAAPQHPWSSGGSIFE